MERLRQSALFQRFWDIAGAASIRVKVLGIVLGVIVLLGTFIMVQMRTAVRQTLTAEMEHQGAAIAESAANEVDQVIDADPALVDHIIRGNRVHYSSAEHNTLVDYIIFDGPDGAPISESYADYVDPATLHTTQPVGATAYGLRYSLPWGAVTEVRAEVPGGRGLIRVGLSDANVEANLTAVTLQIVSITLVMVGVGLAAAYFLTWILTRPIFDLRFERVGRDFGQVAQPHQQRR